MRVEPLLEGETISPGACGADCELRIADSDTGVYVVYVVYRVYHVRAVIKLLVFQSVAVARYYSPVVNESGTLTCTGTSFTFSRLPDWNVLQRRLFVHTRNEQCCSSIHSFVHSLLACLFAC